MTTYVNVSSEHKQNVRELIFRTVSKNFPKSKRLIVYSLPNLNFDLEEALYQHYPKIELNLIEREASLVNKIALHWVGRATTYYGDLFKVLESPDSVKANLIWADLCSSVTFHLVQNLNLLMRTHHSKCVVAVTIMGNREQGHDQFKAEYGIKSVKEMREKFPKLITQNTSFQLVDEYAYKSDLTRRAPMTTYLFSNFLSPKTQNNDQKSRRRRQI